MTKIRIQTDAIAAISKDFSTPPDWEDLENDEKNERVEEMVQEEIANHTNHQYWVIES